MKFSVIASVVIVMLTGFGVHAGKTNKETERDWLIDSYKYGKAGKNCSEIYYNYGLPNWTFSSDDPDMLKRLHDACTAGQRDRESGKNNLPEMLKDWDSVQ